MEEADVQAFLERHPCMAPGPAGYWSGAGYLGTHGPMHNLLFSQPPLPGIRRPIPDLMWINRDSEHISPVLIELESPYKPWFTKSGEQSSELTQALGQLATWQRWFSEPANAINFGSLYRIESRLLDSHVFAPLFLLVFGRRDDLERDTDLAKQRGFMKPAHVQWMTYDRLAPHNEASDAVCVRVHGRRFEVMSVSPTITLGPSNARSLLEVDGLREAINANSAIRPARRKFLLDRLSYWEDWARSDSHFHGVGDRE
jgi:hypothetical protein